MDTYIYLFNETKQRDNKGVYRNVATDPRGVFAELKSVTRAEFFEGGRNGLNPQYQFTIFRGDYDGERVVEYEGETYAVYRTYIADEDYIELYVERQGGTNGKESNS